MSVIDSCVGEVWMATATQAQDGSFALGTFIKVGEQVSWDVTENTEVKKRKVLGRCSPKTSPGQTDWDMKMKGYLDIGDDGQLLVKNGEFIACRVVPSGEPTKYYEGVGIFSSVKRDGDADSDYANLSYDVAGDGELTKQGVV